MAYVKFADELASLFGKEHVLYLSQDDKAYVPLGPPIYKKQTAILMHMDYKVHYKVQKEDGTVGYSSPTYIAIRSEKHDNSCVNSHMEDFRVLVGLDEFKSVTLVEDELKPLVFVSVDGGPDEAPKHSQTLAVWADHFCEYNIDALLVFTHVPGYSAYNHVERRMAPLSKDTAGIVLLFNTFRSHLDASNKTIDRDVEMKNIAARGKILANVWSEPVIDGYPVVATYIDPPECKRPTEELNKTEGWKHVHVQQSQYMLQIVKGNDRGCCKPWRTNYPKFFPSRFLPPPIPIARIRKGLEIKEGGHFHSLFQSLHIAATKKMDICYDEFCTSLQKKVDVGKSVLMKRKCPKYNLYHSTINAMKIHSFS